MYKLLHHIGYECTRIYDYNKIAHVAEHLYNNMNDDDDDYELLEVSRCDFDLRDIVANYVEERSALRAAALNKLTDQEKLILGLSND